MGPINISSSRALSFARGFSLHAATRIDADDRAGLERLARLRHPTPLAAGRLQIIDDEHLTFRLKTPWSDGTSFLVLSPPDRPSETPAATKPRLRGLEKSNSNSVGHRRHDGDLRQKITSPTL